jgi:dolichyl-phosphate-mannose--protein O-mannosyl transferase
MFSQSSSPLGTLDAFVILSLLIAAFWTRLWLQAEPDVVVFDEIYFGNFTSEYLLGRYFFDIHPPLGKLILTLFAWLADYDPSFCFETHGSKPYDDEEFLVMRLIPELCSALCVPCVYTAMRLMVFSIPAGITAAGLALFENSLITEGRLILTDGILHFFVCLHVVVLLHSLRAGTLSSFLACGLSLGAACSCKNTAWGLLALTAVCHGVDLFLLHGVTANGFALLFWRGLVIGLCTFSIYFVCFIIHFWITPFSGPGVAFLPEETIDTFLPHDRGLWGIRLRPPHLFKRIWDLVLDMHFTNMDISPFHAFESRPITWPLLTGAHAAFWSDVANFDRHVNCNGNLYVYVLVFYAIIVLSFCAPVNRVPGHLVILFGYYISYLPFFLINRAMFLYHYHIPLFFGCMSVGALQDLLVVGKLSIPVSIVAVDLALTGFRTWYPFVYGTVTEQWMDLEWDKRWIYGDEVHKRLEEADALESSPAPE